jgi:hypothetical protein
MYMFCTPAFAGDSQPKVLPSSNAARARAMPADSTSDSWYSGGASSFFGVDLNGDGEDDGMLRVAVITVREYLDSLTEDERTRITGLFVVSFIGLLACVAARIFKRCCCPHADKLLL